MADPPTPTQQGMVSYEELGELEKEFDDTETEILLLQTKLQAPLYAKRAALVAKIPHFWPLVLETSPPEIDQHIQPSDTNVLVSHLLALDVSRFDVPPANLDPAAQGDPRSLAISFTFSPNPWFKDEVLEKRFWYRRAKGGFAGLVSEPVKIDWVDDEHDLSRGLTDLAHKAWKAEQDAVAQGEKVTALPPTLPEQKALLDRLDAVPQDSRSFFTWFGFRGLRVSAEESRVATAKERERRLKVAKKTGAVEEGDDSDDEDEDEDEEVEELERVSSALEVFEGGTDLAVTIAEDLFPGALKYFTDAQEAEMGGSGGSFEDSGDEGDELESGDEGGSDEDGDGPVDIPNLLKRGTDEGEAGGERKKVKGDEL